MEHQQLARDLVSYTSSILRDGTPTTDSTKVQAIETDLNAKVAAKDYQGLATSILEIRNTLIQKEEVTDVEGCFAILSKLVFQLEASVYEPLVTDMFTKIADSKSMVQLRLRILTNLFNLTEECVSLRLTGLSQIIKYASNSNNFKLVQSYFSSIEKFFKAGQVTGTDMRPIYQLMAECSEKNKQDEIEVLKYLALYLHTFQNEPLVQKTTESAAVKGAVAVIRNPIDTFNQGIDLVDLDAVKQLRDEPKHSDLYELLLIFSRKTLQDYMAFLKTKSGVLTTYGLNAEECLSNIRLLSLCSFVQREEVTYAQITEALQVPEDQVEVWVVKAITCNLVQAKIDQLRRVVTINHCINRHFSRGEWESLGERLALWKTNIAQLLEKIQTARQA